MRGNVEGTSLGDHEVKAADRTLRLIIRDNADVESSESRSSDDESNVRQTLKPAGPSGFRINDEGHVNGQESSNRHENNEDLSADDEEVVITVAEDAAPEIEISKIIPGPGQALSCQPLMSEPVPDEEVTACRLIQTITLDGEGASSSQTGVYSSNTRTSDQIVIIDLTQENDGDVQMQSPEEDDDVIFLAQVNRSAPLAQVAVEEANRIVVLPESQTISMIYEAANPLLHYVVLKNVMKYLTFKELKAYRHVCQKWNEVAVKYIRVTHAQIQLYSDEDFWKFIQLAGSMNPNSSPFTAFTMSQAALDQDNFSLFPLVGYSMRSLCIAFRETGWVTGGGAPYSKLVEAFQYLQNLEHLELVCCGGSEIDGHIDYEQLAAVGEVKLLRLRSLVVSNAHTYGLLVDLFRRSENLEIIELKDCRYEFDSEITQARWENFSFINALKYGLRPKRPLDLMLGNDLLPSQLRLIHEAGYKFTRFLVWGGTVQILSDFGLLKAFLLAQTSTLRFLSLDGGIPQPGLNPAELFQVESFLGPNISVSDALNNCSLDIERRPDASTLVWLESEALKNLVEDSDLNRTPGVVELQAIYTPITLEDLGRLPYVFPNLKRLLLGFWYPLSGDQAEEIFTGLGNIEELKMTIVSESADSVLTGFNSPLRVWNEFVSWKAANQNVVNLYSTHTEILEKFIAVTEMEHRPSLRDMKSLQKLTLTLRAPEDRLPSARHVIRCATVRLAFIVIPPLKRLAFSSVQIRAPGRRALAEYHQIVEFGMEL